MEWQTYGTGEKHDVDCRNKIGIFLELQAVFP